jgi:hypothetical protein
MFLIKKKPVGNVIRNDMIKAAIYGLMLISGV